MAGPGRDDGKRDAVRASFRALRAAGFVFAASLALSARLPADALLLVDGTSFEGEVKESDSEYEIVTEHGSLWIDKGKVRKRIGTVDQILAQVEETHAKARTLFDQAKQIDDRALQNKKLRDALKTLEGARDALAEAQEVYTSSRSYVRISPVFKTIIQELRVYRDQFQVGVVDGPASGPKPAGPATGGATAGGGVPAPATPAAVPAAGGGAPADSPSPASSAGGAAGLENELAALAKEVRARIEKGDADAAYVTYQQYVREGGDAAALRADVAKAFYERGMKQVPPALTDLRRAFDLDPSALSYFESFMQASYDKGLESARAQRWNDATKEFTQAIRAASELLAKSEKAKYHNVRGMAYHWRGISEVQKFKGRGGPSQIRSDYRQAKQDYEYVLKLDPSGPYASEARDNLDNVNKTLSQLR
jgi:tetratricopeptide (TPR) repeat protein